MLHALSHQAIDRSSLVTQKADVLADCLSRIMGRVRVLPAAGRQDVEARSDWMSWDDVIVARYATTTGFQVNVLAARDVFACFIPLVGELAAERSTQPFVGSPGRIHFASVRTIGSLTVAPGTEHLVVAVARPALEQRLSIIMGDSARLVGDMTLAIDRAPPHGSALSDLVGFVIDASLRDSATTAPRCDRAVMDLLIGAFGPERMVALTRPHPGLSARHVLAAEDLMRENPLASVPEIADRLGLSVRALQYAFQRHRGKTPLQIIIAQRLVAARDDILARPGVALSVIAAAQGFGNAGRFASLFREAFGETPRDFRIRTNRAAAR